MMYKSKFGRCWLFVLGCLFFISCSDISVDSEDEFKEVVFPDGSVAYLNHHTSVGYDEGFSNREIFLKGEAFFSITKSDHPFTVQTDNGSVVVLGTEFNVQASDEVLEVEVQSGKVQLQNEKLSTTLTKGEKAISRKGDKEISRSKASFQYKLWMKRLEKDFHKMGKQLKYQTEEFGEQARDAAHDLRKKIKSIDIK